MIATYNIHMFKGNDYSMTMQILSAGTPLNLTGCMLTLTAKWSAQDPLSAAVFQLTSPSTGINITGPLIGTFIATIPSGFTINLPSYTLYLPYDIQLIDTAGVMNTILNGTVIIQPSITS